MLKRSPFLPMRDHMVVCCDVCGRPINTARDPNYIQTVTPELAEFFHKSHIKDQHTCLICMPCMSKFQYAKIMK
jgi:hypothetical protein